MTAGALVLLATGLLACEEPQGRPEPVREPAAEPSRATLEPCRLAPATSHAGAAAALAPGGIVVRDASGHHLVPLDGEGAAGSPVAFDAVRVPYRGAASRGDGWVVLAQMPRGPGLYLVESGAARALPLAAGAAQLRDGALALRGDEALAAWTDDEGALRLSRADLLRERAGDTEVLASIEGGPRLAAVGRSAAVSWTGAGASRIDIGDGPPLRAAAPGVPLELVAAAGAIGVLHRSSDRTGLWLSIPGEPAVRVTHPEARPIAPSIAALPDGWILAYVSEADIFVQRLGVDATPRGGPMLVGAGDGHARPLVAAREREVWLAWESTDSGAIHVRAGRCD